MYYFKFDAPIIPADKNITQEQIWQGIKKQLRMRGLTLEADAVSENIDTVYAVKSQATSEQIDKICTTAYAGLVKAFNGIYSGSINIKPVRVSGCTACDYCPYHSICQFDTAQQGNSYSNIKKISKEEFFA